jgi:EF-P beta-lysylation protein EpmB
MSAKYITASGATPTWQQEQANAFSDIYELCSYLEISIQDLPVSTQAAKNFPLRVPLDFAARMEKGNPEDPLLKQVLPISHEMLTYRGFNNDPVGDLKSVAASGLLHKYPGRVLLINTGSCAINCRYCFRRNFPYADQQLSRQKEHEAIQYVQNDPSITEVILSGGDPLSLNDARIASLINNLGQIEHLLRIRIHTRVPIVLPGRITPALIKVLTQSSKQIIMVVHVNHGNEINAAVAAVCFTLKQHDVTLLNQSVLLKGVNDSSNELCKLSEKLFTVGVLPYYLHLLDKAIGTGHFEVDEKTAIKLMGQVKNRLPGYLVPKLVREQAGMQSKLAI